MLKTNFSVRNKIWGHKRNFGGTAPECPPVATGLQISILKKYSKFKCAVRQRCNANSSANPHQNLEKSQLQDTNLE